jgi:hypothetical protein
LGRYIEEIVHFLGGRAWVEMRTSMYRILQLLHGMIKLSVRFGKGCPDSVRRIMRVDVPADVTLADVLG